jgi:hypothetical protein
LHESVDELAACLPSKGGDLASDACGTALNSTDNEFWLANQPNGYQHTGLFNTWNISSDISEFSVLAETEDDFKSTVKFAHDHNLRLVVKNTGHDWYGRSTAAGSLLLWTHLPKSIDWHDHGFIADGCDPSSSLPAVTVGSGVQFKDLYYPAHARGKIIMGGTCDSVGVGGCWTAGCYGPFTKKFGNGAINIIQVRVVLANGTLVTANKCKNPDLFWSIRGGGGGNTGVITEFTARSHRTPKFMSAVRFSGSSGTAAEYKQLLVQTLKMGAATSKNASTLCNDGSLVWKQADGTTHIQCSAYEGDVPAMKSLFQPLVAWARAQGGGIKGSISGGVSWNDSSFDPKVLRLD